METYTDRLNMNSSRELREEELKISNNDPNEED